MNQDGRIMKRKTTKAIQSYLWITLGTVLLTAGVYFFKFPNNFTTGGVSGLSILFGSLTDAVSPADFIMLINVALLIIGFIFLGNGFGIKTVYSSLLFSGLSMVFERLIPLSAPLTDQPLLELMFAILLPGIGSAIIFSQDASSGGTDITAMILRKYTDIAVGKSLLICDGIIAASALFIFDIRTGLFSVLGLILKAFVIDNMIESFNICKFFIIVTEQDAAVCDFIMNTLHHGATVADATGAFTHSKKKMVYLACRRSEAILLKRRVKELDPQAFTFITNSSEIIGRGFRTL